MDRFMKQLWQPSQGEPASTSGTGGATSFQVVAPIHNLTQQPSSQVSSQLGSREAQAGPACLSSASLAGVSPSLCLFLGVFRPRSWFHLFVRADKLTWPDDGATFILKGGRDGWKERGYISSIRVPLASTPRQAVFRLLQIVRQAGQQVKIGSALKPLSSPKKEGWWFDDRLLLWCLHRARDASPVATSSTSCAYLRSLVGEEQKPREERTLHSRESRALIHDTKGAGW